MAESVKFLPPEIQDIIEVRVWNVKELPGIERKAALGARGIPSIAVGLEMVFESVIPTREDLIAAILERYPGE